MSDNWGDPLKEAEKPKVEVEVVEDKEEDKTPKPREAPREDNGETDSDDISERVQKRINKVVRQRQEALEAHQRDASAWETERTTLQAELQRTRKSANDATSAGSDNYQKQLKDKIALAKTAFEDAYDTGNKTKLSDAQIAISEATAELKLLEATRIRMPKEEVQEEPQQRQTRQETRQKPTYSPQAMDWAKDNDTWFGKPGHRKDTAFALGLNQDLLDEGYDPDGDDFYKELSGRLKKELPRLFEADEEEEEERPSRNTPRKKSSQVLSGGRGSPSTVKIQISRGQEEMARRLGVPIDVYSENAEAAKNTDANGYATIPTPRRR